MFHLPDGIHGRLGGRHRQVKREVVVGVQKVKDFLLIFLRRIGFHNARRHLADEQRGRRLVSVMHLVAHLHGLRDQVLQIDRTVNGKRFFQDGIKRLFHPFQMRDDFFTVGAKAQHLTESLVLRAVREIALSLVLNNEHRHGGGHDTGHRSDRRMVVTGIKFNLA